MDCRIRECLLTDSDAVSESNRNEMGYDYPQEATRQKIKEILSSKHDKIYVAVLNEKVVGYIHANDYNLTYAPTMKNIMGIAVSSEYKRCGIGKKLLIAVEEWAKADGAKGVRLVSGISREEAHVFYEHCGYGGGNQQLNYKKYF